jgi:hypothetical protein
VTREAASPASRRWTVVRIVNAGAAYAFVAALAGAVFLVGGPVPALVVAMLAGLPLVFLYDAEDDFDRMFWTQIAHGLHARALMRKPIRRLPTDPCPPSLVAVVKPVDQHPHPLLVAESDGEQLMVLDWTTWDQPDQDYYLLVAVNAAGAMTAITYFSKWPKAWGSPR